jgi:hypothetical protein
MPDVTYDLEIEEAEREAPIAMQVICYDSEGENLANVAVTLELIGAQSGASLSPDAKVLRQDIVTDARGKFYFHVYPTSGRFEVDSVRLRGTWTGTDPFVFIQRFHPEAQAKETF